MGGGFKKRKNILVFFQMPENQKQFFGAAKTIGSIKVNVL
jgi:hypothetical protein